MLPTTPAVRMVASALEEGPGKEATPIPSEESDSSESYEATPDDITISQGDIEIAVRVAQALEKFTGQCKGATRSDIEFVMRSVRCTTPNFKTHPGDLSRPARADRPPE